MTRLERGKTVRREVSDPRRGELVITLTDVGILVRQKGKRTTYGPIGYGLVMLQGEKAMAETVRREKLERRKLRGLVRGR